MIDYFSKVTVNQYITLVIESNSNYIREHANVIVIWCIIYLKVIDQMSGRATPLNN